MPLPPITAVQAHVVNMDTGQVYYTLDDRAVLNRASTIKGHTVMTMLEYCYQTEAQMKAATETVISADIVGGTGVPLVVGDVWSMWDLALNALFPSSNDACQTLARHCGDKLYADSGNTGTQGVTRFVEAMNTLATQYGMDDATITRPDGLTGNTLSMRDLGQYMRGSNVPMFDHVEFRPLFKASNVDYEYNGGANSGTFLKEGIGGVATPGYVMSKAGTGGNYWGVQEIPNGQHLGIALAGSEGDVAAEDAIAIYRAVLVDFPETATPGLPADFDWIATRTGGNVVAWDETSPMYQDDGTTTPAVNDGDKVWRWYPVAEVGVSGYYLRAPLDTLRPDRETSLARRLLDFSGGGYRLELQQSGTNALGIGDTEHFADATDAWMTVMQTFGSGANGTVFARRGAAGGIDLQLFYNSATSIGNFIRNTSNSGGIMTPAQNSLNKEGVHGTAWDGANHRWLFGQLGQAATNVGTAGKGTAPFSIGAHGGGFAWAGGYGRIIMADAYDFVAYEKMRDWSLGVTTNQIRDPSGGVVGGVKNQMIV